MNKTITKIIVMCCLTLLYVLPSRQAFGHLLPENKGTINLVGNIAYVAIAIPWNHFSDVLSGSPHKTHSQENRKAIENAFKNNFKLSTPIHGKMQYASWDAVLLQPHAGDHSSLSNDGYLLVIAVAKFTQTPSIIRVQNDFKGPSTDKRPDVQIRMTQSVKHQVLQSKTVILTVDQPVAEWKIKTK